MKAIAVILAAFIMVSCTSTQESSRLEGAAVESGSRSGSQRACPVMEGKRINPRLFVDYQGVRIYVCCNPCVKAVRKDPEKYLRKLQDQNIAIEKVTQLSSAEKD